MRQAHAFLHSMIASLIDKSTPLLVSFDKNQFLMLQNENDAHTMYFPMNWALFNVYSNTPLSSLTVF